MIDSIKKAWYDHAWRSGMRLSRPAHDYARYVKMLNIPDPYCLLLDIGCGNGRFLSLIQNICACVGIDISSAAIERARVNASRSEFKECGVETFNTNNKYNYITAIGSIEHCDNITVVLSKMRDLGTDDCKYLIVVPNKDFIGWKIKAPGTAQQEIGETMLSLSGWRNLFELSGFKIERVTYDLGRSWMKLFTWAIPIRYTYQFVFVMTKAVK